MTNGEVEGRVREVVAQSVRMEPGAIGFQVPFEDLGLDSIGALLLIERNDPLPDAKAHAPQTSEATRAIIFKMMAKRPEQRYQSARDVEVSAKVIEDALARGETPLLPGMPGAPSQPVTAAALAASGVRKAPVVASVGGPGAAPAAKAPPPAAPKGGKKLGSSMEGKKAKDPEVAERLRRIAKKKRGGRV